MNQYQFEDLISDYVENKLTISKRKDVEKLFKRKSKRFIKSKPSKRKYFILKSSKNKGKFRF